MKKVGFWKNPSSTAAGITESNTARGKMSNKETDIVVKYIDASSIKARYRGWANCRFCDDSLGSCDMETPDGLFVFPQKYEHYIISHGVRPPKQFIDAAMKWRNKDG